MYKLTKSQHYIRQLVLHTAKFKNPNANCSQIAKLLQRSVILRFLGRWMGRGKLLYSREVIIKSAIARLSHFT